MLLTIDLNFLIGLLISEFGESIQLNLGLMNETERRECSIFEEGIVRVNERAWLFEEDENGNRFRREDLEQKVFYEGRK